MSHDCSPLLIAAAYDRDNYSRPMTHPEYQPVDWRNVYLGHPCYSPGKVGARWMQDGIRKATVSGTTLGCSRCHSIRSAADASRTRSTLLQLVTSGLRCCLQLQATQPQLLVCRSRRVRPQAVHRESTKNQQRINRIEKRSASLCCGSSSYELSPETAVFASTQGACPYVNLLA